MRLSDLCIRYGLILLTICSLLTSSGCATPPRISAVPPEYQNDVRILGMPGIRFVPTGAMSQELKDEVFDSFSRESEHLSLSSSSGRVPTAHFLAISGGGDNGAFAAGLLNGWTAAGTRPEFKLVTGISTGALIAPFAFLGPKYDHSLKEFYTTSSPQDILKQRNLLAVFLDDAMADNKPLWNQVSKQVDEGFLREIAVEYEKGRMLLLATTNLDRGVPVIWNMGKIAASGHKDALDLFRKIMIASAAIPGFFPPEMIDVEANGKPYQEMHVDGGASAQTFLYPASVRLRQLSDEVGVKRKRKAYIIRNARLDTDWAEIERRTLKITGRAIASLLQSQGIGDLYRIYLQTEVDKVDFNLAFIPPTFKAEHKEEFDTEYMRALYKFGYDMAAKGYPWMKKPPGFSKEYLELMKPSVKEPD